MEIQQQEDMRSTTIQPASTILPPEDKLDSKRSTAYLLFYMGRLAKHLEQSKHFQDFVKTRKAQKMAEGINPDAVACAGRLIAKYREIGIVEFSEIAEEILEHFGAEDLRLFFPSLKAAYGAIVAQSDDPELTTMGDLEKMTVDSFTFGSA